MSEDFYKKRILDFFKNDYRAYAFSLKREGKSIPLFIWLKLLIRSIFFETFISLINNFPGSVGIQLRLWFYSIILKNLGKNCIFSSGITLEGTKNISISDFVWLDKCVELNAMIGSIKIGKRVHVGNFSYILGYGDITIEDYVGISSYVRIYSHTEAPYGGLRMSGPMVPENNKSMKTKPVKLCKDSFIGTGSVILPGVTIGEGAVVGANSVVHKDVGSWEIVSGNPAVIINKREPIKKEIK